ncbi:MAG: glutathione S-transferase family protein [bacterium]
MGFLVKGKWHDKWYDTKKDNGHFKRQASQFRQWIGSEAFPVEADRYHLIVSHACPWAHRTTIFRKLKALTNIISISVVKPVMLEHGWEMTHPDTHFSDVNYLYQLYLRTAPDYEGRVTVPVLWDLKQQRIVNNESSDIIRMFNSCFNKITGHTTDYYPAQLQSQIDAMNELVYHRINNGVYKVGFSTDQAVYSQELHYLFEALQKIETILSKSRYLCGSTLTEADWRLFTTLIRFDSVYVGHFKCNLKRIHDYPHLSHYLKELYAMPGIKETIHFDDIKTHYYVSHPMINPTQIIPDGPQLDLDEPHNRDLISSVK